jgi:hypothetical protein
MAKRSNRSNPRAFADRSAAHTMDAANFGVNWFREIAEQGLNQSRAVLDGYLAISKKAVDSVDRQATDMNKRSMLIAEETLSNAYDFAQKLVSVREPQQLATLQSEFVSRQAQIFADQMKDVGKNIMQEATDAADTTMRTVERSRKRSA